MPEPLDILIFLEALIISGSLRSFFVIELIMAICLEIKSSETPVVLSKNVGRDGEKIQIINLSELKSSLVDMLTVVIIGNNSTQRIINSSRISSVYTPRGYLSTKEQAR